MKIDIPLIYLASSLVLGCFSADTIAQAQIATDGSLPTPTQITRSDNYFQISGGTEAGANLFHSFNVFSIPEGSVAQFINNSVSIQNVIGRVTGTNSSNILGKIEAGGTATNFNLFLVNPNGIVFGPQASLDIRGSFVATTANALQFGDRGFFSASSSSNPSLLTINPTAFFFNQIRPQSIVYESSLNLPNNKSLLLLGGNVKIDGGSLNVPNGRIELGGLAEPGMVTLNMNGDFLSLEFPNDLKRSDISLTNGTFFNVQDKGSGSIAINAQNIDLSGGSLLLAGISPGFTSDTTNPGGITLNATQAVTFEGINSGVANIAEESSIGNTGQISITADSFNINGFSGILTYALGKGNSGGISLNIRKGITMSRSNYPQPAFIVSAVGPNEDGVSGEITIHAGSLSLSDGSVIRSNVLGKGNAGNISIQVDDFIKIVDSDEFPSQIRTVVEAGAIGNGGNIDIHARSLSLTGGGQLTAAVLGPDGNLSGGQGRGGNISVTTSDSVIISGISANNFVSGIFADTELGANGPAGNVTITTNFLKIDDGAQIKLSNPQGQAGNLTVNANRLTLNNGKITAETGGDGSSNGANINLKISELLRLENESLISARARGNANGGNIKIDTSILLALSSTGSNGSDIIASAEFGKGGNITINAKGIFGITERKAFDGNLTNDIDASSLFGRSGRVEINTAIDPNNGLIELPETVVDPDYQVAQNPCNRGWGNEFTVSGRGGLPPSPSQDLSSEATQIKLVKPVQASNGTQNNSVTPEKTSSLNSVPAAIVPAQGWVYNKKGQVVLVAYNPTATGAQRLKASPAGCPVP
jgi:filamentous hemagglutinin family protein